MCNSEIHFDPSIACDKLDCQSVIQSPSDDGLFRFTRLQCSEGQPNAVVTQIDVEASNGTVRVHVQCEGGRACSGCLHEGGFDKTIEGTLTTTTTNQ